MFLVIKIPIYRHLHRRHRNRLYYRRYIIIFLTTTQDIIPLLLHLNFMTYGGLNLSPFFPPRIRRFRGIFFSTPPRDRKLVLARQINTSISVAYFLFRAENTRTFQRLFASRLSFFYKRSEQSVIFERSSEAYLKTKLKERLGL